MEIQPGKQFIITRQLGDPIDTNTYYVRAFIRKAGDDSLISTVDLIDKGDQRFRGVFDTPYAVDPFYITITTKVFTDSGYTLESQDYQRIENQYLVQSRVVNLGGGGDARIDYKKLAQAIKDLIPTQEKIDLSFIGKEFKKIADLVKNIEIPEYKPQKIEFPPQVITDFAPVLRQIDKVAQSINQLKNTDLSPVIAYLHDLEKAINDKADITEIKNILSLIPGAVRSFNKSKDLEKAPTPKKPERVWGQPQLSRKFI